MTEKCKLESYTLVIFRNLYPPSKGIRLYEILVFNTDDILFLCGPDSQLHFSD